MKIQLKKSLKLFILSLLVMISFSNCTVFRYFEPYFWWIIIAALFVIKIRIRKDFDTLLLLTITLFLFFTSFLSYNFSITFKYFGIVLTAFLLYSEQIDDTWLNTFFKICFYVSFAIAISICIEYFINEFNAQYLWFFAEVSPSKKGALLDTKLGEIAYGAYSGLAFEKADAAYYVNIGIGYVLSTCMVKKDISKKEMIELSIMLIALLLTGKRMLLLITIFNSTLIFLLSGVKNKFIKLFLVAIVIIIVFILLMQFIPALSTTFERLQMTAGEDDAMAERYVKWFYAIRLFIQKPFIGFGFGTYNEACEIVGYNASYYAHNIYVQMLSEIGLIGTILFISYMSYKLISNFSLILKNKEVIEYYNLNLFFLLYIQLLFVIYGLSGNVLYYPCQLIFYLIVTIALSKSRKKEYLTYE